MATSRDKSGAPRPMDDDEERPDKGASAVLSRYGECAGRGGTGAKRELGEKTVCRWQEARGRKERVFRVDNEDFSRSCRPSKLRETASKARQ
ncbi:hypothetical protein KM043_009262 [Ampulex compressa]|nr:hypothetical protein KM043_009262 [Ampulex compressa]